MKKILLLVITIAFFISCKNTDAEKKVEIKNKIILNKPKENIQDYKSNLEENNHDKILKSIKLKYSNVYEYKIDDQDVSEIEVQWLGIKYLENNCIDFYLYSDTLPCITEYYGKACLNQNDTINTEVQNNADRAVFTYEEKEYKLSIILNKKLNQAEIDYMQKDSLGIDCLPVDKVRMSLLK